MRIITISREFGSGGRELGKRMADLLCFAYYDKEIISAISRENNLDESYVNQIIEKGSQSYPMTIGRTFSYPSFLQQNTTKILVAQRKIIQSLAAQGDCIVMGQSADVILQAHSPLNLFIYADMPSKMKRCRECAPEGEGFTDKELVKKIKQVDAARAKSRELLSSLKWGQKESYHLCINTTDIPIKTLAPHVADYAKYWLGINKI